MSFIVEPERRLPVVYDVDVAVVGGGTAGVVAAIAAARTGARTVLIERFGSLGGCPTVGRMASMANRFLDAYLRKTIAGIPLEIMDRLVKTRGVPYSTLEEALRGKIGVPYTIPFDPETLAYVLIQMVEETGVDLMLHTFFSEAIMEGDKVCGVIVQNKSGRQAVKAKVVVDASGEADVAASAGAPYISSPKTTWGLLMRIGNVDIEKIVKYFLSIEAGKPQPEYTEWLAKYLGLSVEEVKKDRYWNHLLDPQPYGHVPSTHPGARFFTPETQKWFKDRWEADGFFYNFEMPVFRDLLKKAVEDGYLELRRKIDNIGEIRFNWDGFAGGAWGKGVVLVNAIMPAEGFDGTNAEHITKAEVAARKRAFELATFFKKYMPGFENSYVIDTGVQTMPRHARMIEGEYTLTWEDAHGIGKRFDDAVYLFPGGGIPGFPHQVPYRIMLPKKVENLLVAGKCASGATYVRSILSCMAMGQAAGTAAALAAKKGVAPRQLDVKDLQETLKEQDVILDVRDMR